jgi:predicted AlkP superfamily phosphohydrolase/phosphomutase
LKPKILIIGIDGVGLDLAQKFVDSGDMPNLATLMASGWRAPLLSTNPPTTLPAWTSFMTGAFPSSHGLTDFTVRDGYRVRFVGAGDRRLPTLFQHLESCGLTAGSAWFPATYPPENLSGYQISGWDSPVTAVGNPSFVHPSSLHEELYAQFGGDHLSFDTIDEFNNDSDWYLKTAIALPKRVERRAEMATWLMQRHPVDVAAFYFGEADTAAHHFWAFFDRDSPRRPHHFDSTLGLVLRNVYRALDEAIGRLTESAGSQASVVLLSDHGSGGASDVALYLNRALENAGLLSFKPTGLFGTNSQTLRGKLPGLLPPTIRRALFRFGGGIAPSLAESRLRFGAIDFKQTSAFSEELNYSPSIWFNQLGREPQGLVPHRDRTRLSKAVERTVLELLSPTGEKLVKRAIRREEIHHGRHINLFPDMILELNPISGYIPACLPSDGQSGPAVSRIAQSGLLGRKGRSLPGCHIREGILVARGAGIPENVLGKASIEDVAPLITNLCSVASAKWFEGNSPLVSGKKKQPGPSQKYPATESPRSGYTAEEEQILAKRLMRLGYLEE